MPKQETGLARHPSTSLAMSDELRATMIEIDKAAATGLSEMSIVVGSFEQAFQTSMAIQRLRELITDELVERFLMPIQNSPLGFLTDRPADKFTPPGYPIEVVRDCVIEGALRGIHATDNEMNIISNRMYIARNGMERKVREYPGLTDLALTPGVPQSVPAGPSGQPGALVPYTATWKLNGEPQHLSRLQRKLSDGTEVDERIPVRVNQGMIVDAILGKAARKMLAAIYALLTGSSALPDGDADDIGPRRLPERGSLKPEDVKPSESPNRGHDDTQLGLGLKHPKQEN